MVCFVCVHNSQLIFRYQKKKNYWNKLFLISSHILKTSSSKCVCVHLGKLIDIIIVSHFFSDVFIIYFSISNSSICIQFVYSFMNDDEKKPRSMFHQILFGGGGKESYNNTTQLISDFMLIQFFLLPPYETTKIIITKTRFDNDDVVNIRIQWKKIEKVSIYIIIIKFIVIVIWKKKFLFAFCCWLNSIAKKKTDSMDAELT